jgi:hypothetical protein
MDARKFTMASASVMIHPRRICALVTDSMPPKSVVAQLRNAGVRLVVAAQD